MIAAATDRRRGEKQDTGERRRRPRPQVVEVRVVVEVQMPQWMHPGGPLGNSMQAGAVSAALPPGVEVSQRSPNADPLRGESQEGKSVPDQDVNGSAFFVTQSESSEPTSVVTTTSEMPPATEASQNSPSTMLELLHQAPASLQRKRRMAGKDQQGKHETSCRAFDRFLAESISCDRFSKPVALTDWIRQDSSLVEPVIRQQFAEFWLVQRARNGELMSTQTIATYWQHVCMVMRAYGVSMQQFTREELDLMRRDKVTESAQVVMIKRRVPTAEELDSICRSAHAAKTVYGEHAPYLMRFLVRFFSCFGLRTNDVISTDPEKTGLRKQDLIWSEDCPDPNINAALGYVLKNPGGWIWIRIHKSEKKHVAVMLLPIPLWARGPLQFFCEFSHHPVRVFPSMEEDSKSLSSATLANDWNAVLKAAEVDSTIRLSEGKGGVIAVRKYSYNWWRQAVAKLKNDVGLAKDVAAYVMHHSEITKTTADRNYAVVSATVLPVIVELLPLFPKPAADAAHVSLLPE